MIEAMTFILVCVAIMQYTYSYYRFSNDLLNPLLYFGYEYVVKIALGGLFLFSVPDINYEVLWATVCLSVVYAIMMNVGFFVQIKLYYVKRIIENSVNYWSSNSAVILKGKRIIIILLMVFFASMIVVAVVGDGGSLWLKDPRYAYQHYRKGVGIFYSMATLSLFLVFIVVLFNCRRKYYLLIAAILISVLAYFTGSKRTIISFLVFGMVYYNYYICRIKFLHLVYVFVLAVVSFLFLLWVQGSFVPSNFLRYFNYMPSSYKIVEHFNLGNPFYGGEVYFSNVWAYIPRILYENKPAFFGGGYVTHILYPGSAEKGHFVGTLEWVAGYIDFGWGAVIVNGFITGVLSRLLYDVFLSSKTIFAFILFVQFTYTPIFKYFPVFAVLILFFIMVNFLRLRLR